MRPHSKPSNRRSQIVGSALLAILLTLVLVLPAMASGGWAPTGSMSIGRSRHLAVRLDDGRVVVASGHTDAAVTTAELYDPATGSWSLTGSMNFARWMGPTMTRLNDGRVLVIGGSQSRYANVPLASAEIYDPASGTWSNTGSLNQGRSRHTATHLADGRVLVVGGLSDGSLASAEIYDPASGTWSVTGSLIEGRFDHTATLLADGRVLAAGGTHSTVPLSSAEIYDPASGTWSSINSMAGTHAGHTATLLDNGKVFIVGGCWPVQGTCGGSSRPDGVELYDLAAGTWARPANLLTYIPDWQTTTKLNDGKVLILGILGGTRQNWLYDPNTDSFAWANQTAAYRRYSTATLLNNGQVLHAGGENLSSPYASADLYIPQPSSPASTLHVGDLDGSSSFDGRRQWSARVTIAILDNNGIAVSGAVVSGNWSGGISGGAVCTTSGVGTCDVYSGSTNKGSVSFTVTNVSHYTLTYDAAANRDPDGDSNGATITVSKP